MRETTYASIRCSVRGDCNDWCMEKNLTGRNQHAIPTVTSATDEGSTDTSNAYGAGRVLEEYASIAGCHLNRGDVPHRSDGEQIRGRHSCC
jgi:hypothetical protein